MFRFGKKKKEEIKIDELLEQLEKTKKINESLFNISNDMLKASNKMLERRH